MLLGGAVFNAVNLALGGDYAGFADQAHFGWVTTAWRAVVAPNQLLFIGLLVAFEAVVGVAPGSGAQNFLGEVGFTPRGRDRNTRVGHTHVHARTRPTGLCWPPTLRHGISVWRACRAVELRGEITKVLTAGGVALVQNRWLLEGTQPDSPIEMRGHSADVLRHTTDGSWRILIDNPWGGG
jgi:hypothetical protein